MFKVLLPKARASDINKCIERKAVLHAYKNVCIPQTCVCKITIAHNNIYFQCNFFSVPGNG